MVDGSKSYVYGHVFESLTAGLYPNKQEILREYIQNAYDAIVAARARGYTDANLIRVQAQDDDLFIHDEGVGMDREQIEEYRFFGYSRKRMEDNVGFRGIGKLAGLAVANVMVVVTKQEGSPFYYTYRCEARQMLQAVRDAKQRGENIPLDELIQAYSTITSTPTPAVDQHYTAVQLYGVRDEDGYLTKPPEISRYLGTVAPLPFDRTKFQHADAIEAKLRQHIPKYQTVQIQVNGNLIYKPFTDSLPLHDLQFIEVPGRGGPRAIAWYLSHKQAKQIDGELPRGLYYRCKGFAVGDETLVRNSIFSAGRAGMVYWYAGEIHVLDAGLIPSASRTEFEDNTARRQFYDAARESIAKPLNSFANRRSNESAFQKESEKASQQMKAVAKKLEKKALPAEVKAKTVADLEETARRLLSKASMVKDPEKKYEAQKTAQQIAVMSKAIKSGEGVRNTADDLNLSKEAKQVYTIVMGEVTRWFMTNAPQEMDAVIDNVHRTLKRRM